MLYSVIVLCFVVRYFVSILIFALFVFLVSRDYCVALPRVATGLFAVCYYGIS